MSGNVALIGAPTTGKSVLALDLRHKLGIKHSVIDGYANVLSDKMNVAIGLWAPYLVNSVIASARLAEELSLQRRDLPHITVGTVLDTIVYQSIHSSRISVQTEEQVHRAQVMMAWLGSIMHDQWNYQYIFYLPYQGNEEMWTFYDAQLREALSLYQVPYARLDGNAEENLEQAIDFIRAEPIDTDFANAEERGVRDGGSDSEEARDSAEPVSGVSDEGSGSGRVELRRANWDDLQVPGD